MGRSLGLSTLEQPTKNKKSLPSPQMGNRTLISEMLPPPQTRRKRIFLPLKTQGHKNLNNQDFLNFPSLLPSDHTFCIQSDFCSLPLALHFQRFSCHVKLRLSKAVSLVSLSFLIQILAMNMVISEQKILLFLPCTNISLIHSSQQIEHPFHVSTSQEKLMCVIKE